MNGLQCEYCNYAATTKANLKRHQTKTNYCIERQKKIKNGEIVPERRIIPELGSVKTVRELKAELRCKDEIILIKDKQIKTLEDQLTKERQNQQNITLAAITKPTTQVKNTIKHCIIQNLPPLLEADMREQSQYLTIDHVKAGAEGYARYAMEYPLKDKITCIDSSRKKLAWKDIDGNIIYDNEGSKLSEKFFRILAERNLKLFREVINDLGDRLDGAYKREDLVEAEAIVELTDKICTYRTQAVKTGKGEDTELKNEFIKYLCIASKAE